MPTAIVNPSFVAHPALATHAQLADALRPRRSQWTPRELSNLTQRLTRSGAAALRGIVEHHAEHRWWTRLALTDEVEVWLLGWSPGQSTRLHDHGGAAGAYTLLDGMLTEAYQDGPGPLRRSITLHATGTSAFGRERVHRISSPGPTNATSLHAYSPPLLPLGYADDDIP